MRNIVIILLISLILSTAGCLLPVPPEPSPTPSEPIDTTVTTTPIEPIDPDWSPTIQSNGGQPLPSIADVVEKVFPSVVTISTEVVTLDIFQRPRTESGAGSGWILDSNGMIVTNNHVVEGAKKITVELSDGRTFQIGPDKIYRDPVTDLAIVKVNATNLPAATLGDSSTLRVGEWVVALGNPLGQGLRAKEGTISGVKVSLSVDQGQSLYDLIETSAAINPGNSGGPLVNMAGEVVGITSAKIAAVGVEGMGYAISERTATPIIEQLINIGYVIRPYLGISPVTVDQYVALINRLSVDKGAVIAYIEPGSPAEKAGLEVLDVIIQFNSKEITTAEELLQAIHSSEVGEEVKIKYVRGDNTKTTNTRLTQSSAPK